MALTRTLRNVHNRISMLYFKDRCKHLPRPSPSITALQHYPYDKIIDSHSLDARDFQERARSAQRVYLTENIEVIRILRKFQLSKPTEVSTKSLSVLPLELSVFPGLTARSRELSAIIFERCNVPAESEICDWSLAPALYCVVL